MDTNEIKPIEVNIPFRVYIRNNDIHFKTILRLGYNTSTVTNKMVTFDHLFKLYEYPLPVEDSNGKQYNAIGHGDLSPDRIICLSMAGDLKTIDIDNLSINVEVVFKEQIKHLKYKEQLKLFDDDNSNSYKVTPSQGIGIMTPIINPPKLFDDGKETTNT